MSANNELIAEARAWDFDRVAASPGKARHMIHTLADRLEATEAQLMRAEERVRNARTYIELTRPIPTELLNED